MESMRCGLLQIVDYFGVVTCNQFGCLWGEFVKQGPYGSWWDYIYGDVAVSTECFTADRSLVVAPVPSRRWTCVLLQQVQQLACVR